MLNLVFLKNLFLSVSFLENLIGFKQKKKKKKVYYASFFKD